MDPIAPPFPRDLGIIGAGRVGLALAALADHAQIDVAVAASRGPDAIQAQVEAAAPRARAATVEQAAGAQVVVLALPLGKVRALDPSQFDGALVIDATNYWWELDGHLAQFEDLTTSSSEQVQRLLPGARVVKALNHLSAYALEELARERGEPDRIAVAVAGDDQGDVRAVRSLVDQLGFEPVAAGALAEGMRFEPGTELFGADADVAEAREMLARFWDSQRGRVVARARREVPRP
ncbi:NADPH-dependent F420 reductase [Demequina sp. NBRC 110053]|uniref:NADPH-dependent F420 reductase n=1 Tax=Demequina sp. NBRC 110053 TaxID=1570342 RepID=UPI00190ED47F|nr:NAD(P)-binding domain-containing protein [Demequina sp. NBRC 110053]